VQQQVVSQPPPIVVQRPVQTPVDAPAPAPPPAPKPATIADISPIVAAYARAIESKDINEVRRIYPGISAVQQRNLEAFWQQARNINVRFRLENLDASTSSADARLVGSYEYLDPRNETKRDPVSFAATFQRDGNVWRLASIR
jgi:hypothetical protein